MLLPACSKWIDRYLNIFGFSGPKDELNLILSRAAIFYPPVNIHSMTMGAFIHYGRPTGHKLAERNFPIKPGQPKGMTLSIFLNSFFESLHKAREVERWNNLSKWNDKFQPPPEVALNIPVEMSRGGPIHLTSDWIFRNVWHNGTRPIGPSHRV